MIAYFCSCCLTQDCRDGQEGQSKSWLNSLRYIRKIAAIITIKVHYLSSLLCWLQLEKNWLEFHYFTVSSPTLGMGNISQAQSSQAIRSSTCHSINSIGHMGLVLHFHTNDAMVRTLHRSSWSKCKTVSSNQVTKVSLTCIYFQVILLVNCQINDLLSHCTT